MKWDVRFSCKAESQYRKLQRNGVRPSINDTIDFLVLEIISKGPEKSD